MSAETASYFEVIFSLQNSQAALLIRHAQSHQGISTCITSALEVGMASKLFFKASECFVPFIAVTSNISQIVTNLRGRYDSFPTRYLLQYFTGVLKKLKHTSIPLPLQGVSLLVHHQISSSMKEPSKT